MRLRFMLVPLVVAIAITPLFAIAQQSDDSTSNVAVGSFKGNPDRACARLAGHPPGRSQCRNLMSHGGALMPAQAYAVAIPGFTGIIHYTSESNGLRVVASLADEDGSPLRIVSMLAPDEAMVFSIPDGVGQSLAEIEMRRRGDFVVIRGVGESVGALPATDGAPTQATIEPSTSQAPTNSGPHPRPLAIRNLD